MKLSARVVASILAVLLVVVIAASAVALSGSSDDAPDNSSELATLRSERDAALKELKEEKGLRDSAYKSLEYAVRIYDKLDPQIQKCAGSKLLDTDDTFAALCNTTFNPIGRLIEKASPID